jgi:hypothetical protein
MCGGPAYQTWGVGVVSECLGKLIKLSRATEVQINSV